MLKESCSAIIIGCTSTSKIGSSNPTSDGLLDPPLHNSAPILLKY